MPRSLCHLLAPAEAKTGNTWKETLPREPDAASTRSPPGHQPRQRPAGEGAAAYSEACGQAFADAAEIDEMQDTVEDLHPAVIACADLEAFAAASADHPEALDGADPATFAANVCRYAEDPQVTGAPLCRELDVE